MIQPLSTAVMRMRSVSNGSCAPDRERHACNVASGRPHTVGEMASALAEAHRPQHQPPLVPLVTGLWRLGDVRHIVASPSLAFDVLGFEAQVPFAVGMAELAGTPLP